MTRTECLLPVLPGTCSHLHYHAVDKEWCVTALAAPEVDNELFDYFQEQHLHVCVFIIQMCLALLYYRGDGIFCKVI